MPSKEALDLIREGITLLGAFWFGAVVGWMVQRAYHDVKTIDSSWIGAMIGVIGGAAVVSLFSKDTPMFGAYCIGLGLFFFIRGFSTWTDQQIAAEVATKKKAHELMKQSGL
jgi:hypothetical protein